MINDLLGHDGVSATQTTPSQWLLRLDAATLAQLSALRRDLDALAARVSALERRVTVIERTIPAPTPPTLAFYRFGHWTAADTIPVDGSITNQAAWNLDTDHAFVNVAWPNTATPTWKAH